MMSWTPIVNGVLLSVILFWGPLFWACSAWGETLVEPTGQNDLASCTVIVTATVTGETSSQQFPASSPQGGGQHPFDPATLLINVEGDATSVATCVDIAGNESVPSNVLTRSFPNVAPPPPSLVP